MSKVSGSLLFAECCRSCGAGLLTDDDGECYCSECTSFRPTTAEPFIATVGSEVVESADSLEELLLVLGELIDEKPCEDIAIWQGLRLVVVLFANGEVLDRRAQ